MPNSVCKCGQSIIFARNPATGKNVPIHLVPVYRLIEMPDGSHECIREEEQGTNELGVNHFITCPNANDFNRGKK